jgi:hypothetical protein
MDLKLTYYGRVEGDLVKIFRAKEMTEMIVRNFAGHDIEITIQRKRKRRSLMQNAYYFGVVLPLVMSGLNDAGYKVSKESTHEFLKATFFKQELVNEQTGEILQTVGSTAKMSTVQMMEYFEDITRWAAEFLNVQIPGPGEQIELL